MKAETAIQMSLLAPLLGAIGIQLAGRKPNLREAVTLVASIVTFCFVWPLCVYIFNHSGDFPNYKLPEWTVCTVVKGVDLAFRLNHWAGYTPWWRHPLVPDVSLRHWLHAWTP